MGKDLSRFPRRGRHGQGEIGDVEIVVEIRPTSGETNDHAPRRDVDLGGNLDQPRSPRAGLAFAQRIALAAAVVVIVTRLAGERLGGKFLGEVFRGRIARRAAQANHQIAGGGVQVEAKEVGQVAMVAQAIGLKTILEFLVAVLAFATVGEGVVGGSRQYAGAGPIGDYRAAVRSLFVGFAFDDREARLRPRSGLIFEGDELPLRRTGLLELFDYVPQKIVAFGLQDRVHPHAEGIIQPQPFADLEHFRNAEGGIAAKVDLHVGPRFSQTRHEIFDVVFRAQDGVGRAVQQADHRHRVVFGAGDGPRQILVLLVITVEERQLLLAVSRVVEGVDVEGQMPWRFGEGSEELIDENVPQIIERADADLIFEAGQRGLTGQGRLVGRAVGEHLEDRVVPQDIVVVLIGVIGENAVQPHPRHFGEGMVHVRGMAGIVQGRDELCGESDSLVELPNRQQSGIAGQLGVRRLDNDRLTRKKIE